MATLRGQIGPYGALVRVTLGPSQFALASGASLGAARISVWGLFDTGADIAVIRPGLAERIGIFPHDRIDVTGLHESTAECNVFDLNLEFDGTGILLPNLTVVEGVVGAPNRVEMLLGRSILWKGVLTYDGIQQRFSFEVPDEPAPGPAAAP